MAYLRIPVRRHTKCGKLDILITYNLAFLSVI